MWGHQQPDIQFFFFFRRINRAGYCVSADYIAALIFKNRTSTCQADLKVMILISGVQTQGTENGLSVPVREPTIGDTDEAHFVSQPQVIQRQP